MTRLSTESEIAVLQTQMTEVKTSLEAIKVDQHTNFTVLASKIDSLANTPAQIETLKDGFDERLKRLEKSRGRFWVWNTLSATAGIALASLIIYAVTKK
jgi:hypothetical protein